MADDDPRQRARENLTSIVSVLVTGIWLAAFFTGQEWWLAFLLVGYVVIVPLVALLFGDEEDRGEWWDDSWADDWNWTGETTTDDDPGRESEDESGADESGADGALATLRDRYARGELTDEQFERKLERLLETETLEDAEDRARRAAADDAEFESDRSR